MPYRRFNGAIQVSLNALVAASLSAIGALYINGSCTVHSWSAYAPQEISKTDSGPLGTVRFPTSCLESAGHSVRRGIALLHSFQYLSADESFRKAIQEDPECSIAFWGRAMALYHQLWDWPTAETLKQGRAYLQQAKTASRTSERETGYISAAGTFFQDDAQLKPHDRLALYSSAMARLSRQYPHDVEAAVFYALTLVARANETRAPSLDRKNAVAILQQLFSENPKHPGAAHYLIHAADTFDHASSGLDAARMYAQIAPGSAHALHMPSHIFTRLGLWQDSIQSNLASSGAAARETMNGDNQSEYQMHALVFLDYAYLQSGQAGKARDLLDQVAKVPGVSSKQIPGRVAYFEGKNAIELHRWDEAEGLQIRSPDLDMTYWARTIGAARLRKPGLSLENFNKLREILDPQEKAPADAGGQCDPNVSIELKEAQAWLFFAQGRMESAITTMRSAAEEDEKKGVDSLAIPARELLADLLFETHDPEEALRQYEAALEYSPNRFDAVYGAARSARFSGHRQRAEKYYRNLLSICGPEADRPEIQEAQSYLGYRPK